MALSVRRSAAISTAAVLLAAVLPVVAAPPPAAAGPIDDVEEIASTAVGAIVDGLRLGEGQPLNQSIQLFTDQIASGSAPTDVASFLTGEFPAAAQTAGDQIGAVGDIATELASLAGPVLDAISDTVAGLHIPDGAISVNTPVGPGWVFKEGSYAEVCLDVELPGGGSVRALVGAATTRQPCGITYDKLDNSAHTPIAFAAFTPNGFDIIAAQAPITAGPLSEPQVDARAYVPVGDRHLRVDLSAATAAHVTVGWTVGVVPEATAGYLSGSFGVAMTVFTTIAAADFDGVAAAVGAAVNGGLVPDGADLFALDPDVAGDIAAGIASTAASLGGDPTIKIFVSGDLALGVSDLLSVPIASGGAWLSLQIPRSGIAGLTGAAVAAFVGSAYRVGEALQVTMAGVVTGRGNEVGQTGVQTAEEFLVGAWEGDVKPVISALGAFGAGITLDVGASIGVGTTIVSAGTASTYIPYYAAGVTVEGGALASAPATLLSDLGDVVVSLLVPQLVEADTSWVPTSGWDAYGAILDHLVAIADGIRISILVSPPGGALFHVTLESGLGPFFAAARSAAGPADVRAIAHAATDAARSGSLAPFGRPAMDTLLNGERWATAAKQITVGVQLGGGFGVSVAKISAGIGATARVGATPVVLAALIADRDFTDIEPGTAAATIGLDVVYGGKATLGNSGLNAYVGADRSVQLELAVSDGGTSRPRAFPTSTVTANGFTVLRFSGTLDASGRPVSGTGFIVLPTGGTVSGAFTGPDGATGVLGTWSGGFTIHGHSLTGTNGRFDHDGIHWSQSLHPIAGQSLTARFTGTLAADGTLTGQGGVSGSLGAASFTGTGMIAGGGYSMAGDLTIDGFELADASLAVADDRVTGHARLERGSRLSVDLDLTYEGGRWRGDSTLHAKASESWGVPNIGKGHASLEGDVTVRIDTAHDPMAFATFYGEACGWTTAFGQTVFRHCESTGTLTGELRPGGKIGFRYSFPVVDKSVTVKFTLDGWPIPTQTGSASAARAAYDTSYDHERTASAITVNGTPVDASDPSPTSTVPGTTTTATVTVTPANDGQTVGVYPDGASAAAAPASLSALAAATRQIAVPLRYGDNLVAITVTSADGRAQSVYMLTIHRTIAPDTTAPAVSAGLVPSPNGAGWRNGPTDVRVTATDPEPPGQPASGVVLVEARIDAGPWLYAADGVYVTTPGEHIVTYRARDAAGNVGTGSIAVNVDLAPPRTSIHLPEPNAAGWFRQPVEATLSAVDDLSGVKATQTSLDGGAWTAGAARTIDAEGTHTLRFRSIDVAGNTETPSSAKIWLDMTAPETQTSADPAANAAGWNRTPVTVTVTATDALSGVDRVQTRVDTSAGPGTWQTTDGASATVPLTTEGVYTVRRRAFDVAGNQSPTGQQTVRIDVTDPITTATADPAPNANGWLDRATDVTLVGYDALSGIDRVQYRLNGGSWTDYAGPVHVGDGGRNVLQYRSIDVAGNVEQTREMVLLIDGTPPEVSIALLPRSAEPLILGVDDESGIDPDATTVLERIPIKWSHVAGGLPIPETDGPSANATLVTMRFADLAGNTVTVTVAVTGSGGRAVLRVLAWSQASADGVETWTAPPNQLSSTAGSSSVVHQRATIGLPPLVERVAGTSIVFTTDDGALLVRAVE